MMGTRRMVAAIAVSTAVALGIATSAYALDCHNVSRQVSSSQYEIATTTTPALSFPLGENPETGKLVYWNVNLEETKGNWYLVALSEGAPEPEGTTLDVWWGFIPPGSVPGFPGSSGNYTNAQVEDLLGLAACPVARQQVHGIQSAACGPEA